jgi:hypothetical protein
MESVSGFKYFLLFIDVYSRNTWIFFLKIKDEVFDRFREFRALVESHIGSVFEPVVSTCNMSQNK